MVACTGSVGRTVYSKLKVLSVRMRQSTTIAGNDKIQSHDLNLMRCNGFAFNLGRSRLLAPQSSADALVFVKLCTETSISSRKGVWVPLHGKTSAEALQVPSVGHGSPEVCGCSKVWEAEGGLLEIYSSSPSKSLGTAFFLSATSSFQTQDPSSLHALGLQAMRFLVHPA